MKFIIFFIVFQPAVETSDKCSLKIVLNIKQKFHMLRALAKFLYECNTATQLVVTNMKFSSIIIIFHLAAN